MKMDMNYLLNDIPRIFFKLEGFSIKKLNVCHLHRQDLFSEFLRDATLDLTAWYTNDTHLWLRKKAYCNYTKSKPS